MHWVPFLPHLYRSFQTTLWSRDYHHSHFAKRRHYGWENLSNLPRVTGMWETRRCELQVCVSPNPQHWHLMLGTGPICPFPVFPWSFSFRVLATGSGVSLVSYANSKAGYTIKERRAILALILGQSTDVFDVFIVHENRASDPTAAGSPDQICRILRQLYLSP